ncbi:transporter [Xanthomonas sp. MUS 060]|uniref:transporter n=1 Tax=Xanthomonas sp. MUS 060 TaxID=1588031 RepID=UPI0005F2BA9B|nr:transporter [Xanthomonas sp. MUS 060]
MKSVASIGCLILSCVANMAYAEQAPIVTDRPDFVESSLTAGDRRLQVETGIAWEKAGAEDGYTTPTLFRYGIGQTWELRLETDGWQYIDVPIGGDVFGLSDISLGLKHHLAGTDADNVSLAWLLHVDLPSGTRKLRGSSARPSLRLVAEWTLSDSISVGAMPGVIREEDEHGHQYTAGIFGVVLGKAWNERYRSFVELAFPQIAHSDDGGTVAMLDVGSAWLVTQDVQLDLLYSHGLNDRSPDHTLSAGVSFRF